MKAELKIHLIKSNHAKYQVSKPLDEGRTAHGRLILFHGTLAQFCFGDQCRQYYGSDEF
jgi:hypothetical protein